jgi:hypothetical protein
MAISSSLALSPFSAECFISVLSALDGSEPASIGAEKRALFGINGHSQGSAVSGLPPLNSRLCQQPSADRPA